MAIINTIPATHTTATITSTTTAISPVSSALSSFTTIFVSSVSIVISCGVVSIKYSSGASNSVYVYFPYGIFSNTYIPFSSVTPSTLKSVSKLFNSNLQFGIGVESTISNFVNSTLDSFLTFSTFIFSVAQFPFSSNFAVNSYDSSFNLYISEASISVYV